MMDGTFRTDLPLSFLRDYEWALNSGQPQEITGEETSSTPVSPGVPYVVGNGPRDASSIMEIQRVYPPLHVWDVNNWYGILGAHHRMTKAQLKAAYMACDGPNDARKTWVFKCLLNEAVRRSYDLLPLGEKYLDDPEVQLALKRLATDEASRLSAMGLHTTAEQVLQAMGLVLLDEAEKPREMLDDHDHLGDDDLVRESDWLYSWYIWKADPGLIDLSLLEDWQLALIRACNEKGIKTRITVGVMASENYAYRIEKIDDREVVFIEYDEFPDPELAELAVEELTQFKLTRNSNDNS
jgi:hypothetical protein